MSESAAPSILPSIFKHFVGLEKDAKYYLKLLKIRESEIERCSKNYRDVQNTLTCCLDANSKFKARITLLESSLEEAEANKRKLADAYRKKCLTLTRNLADARRAQDCKENEMHNEFKRQLLDTEKQYTDKLNKQELEYEKRIDEASIKLHREIVNNSKLKDEVESLIKTNTDMRNEIRHLQSKSSTERADLEIELSSVKDINKSVNSDVLRLRRDLDRSVDRVEKLKKTVAEYQAKLEHQSSKSDGAHRENKDCKRVNSKLNNDVMSYRNKNKDLRAHVDKLLTEQGRLKSEIERYKVIANAKPSQVKCTVADHDQYEKVAKQNFVLQEIVKTMRREKINKENKDLRNAENRIEKLEGAIEAFKKNVLLDSKSPMLNTNHIGEGECLK